MEIVGVLFRALPKGSPFAPTPTHGSCLPAAGPAAAEVGARLLQMGKFPTRLAPPRRLFNLPRPTPSREKFEAATEKYTQQNCAGMTKTKWLNPTLNEKK